MVHRKPLLVKQCKKIGIFCIVVGSVVTLFVILVGQWHRRETFESDAEHRRHLVTLCFNGSFVSCNVLYLALLRCRRFVARIRSSVIEASMVLVLAFIMAGIALCSPESLCNMEKGADCSRENGQRSSDSSTLLSIVGILTTIHVALPVRWVMMLPIEIGSVLLVAVMITIGASVESPVNRGLNLLKLMIIVTFQAMGKRASECRERQAFVDIVQEKSLRCDAEFKLSQILHERAARHLSDSGSEPSTQATSKPRTAASSDIFDPLFQTGSGIAEQLACVRELGEAEHWYLDAAEVRPLPDDLLGRGGYGRVVRGTFCGTIVAVKLAYDRRNASNARRIPELCNELRVMRHVRHPNIVTIYGATVDTRQCQIALVLELVQGVELGQFLTERRELGGGGDSPSTLARFQLMLGVCHALLYLHTRRPHIVHGDLTGRNIMVELAGDGLRPKLLDFGLSRVLSSHARALGGTLSWVAPEVYQDAGPVKCSADCYTFGLLLAFIATSIPPRSMYNAEAIRQSLLQGWAPLPEWPEGCAFGPPCKPLVHACLRRREADRPRIAEIHQKLLGLPQELGLVEEQGRFLEEIRAVAAHSLGGGQPLGPEPVADGQPQPGSRVESRLPSLPEEAPLQAESAEPLAQPLAQAESPRTVEEGSLAPPEGQAAPHPYPHRPETSSVAMEASLMTAVVRWNYALPPRACCEKHNVMRIALEVCSAALARPCFHAPLQHKDSQCWSCGILGIDTEGNVCDQCGVDQEVSDSSSASN